MRLVCRVEKKNSPGLARRPCEPQAARCCQGRSSATAVALFGRRRRRLGEYRLEARSRPRGRRRRQALVWRADCANLSAPLAHLRPTRSGATARLWPAALTHAPGWLAGLPGLGGAADSFWARDNNARAQTNEPPPGQARPGQAIMTTLHHVAQHDLKCRRSIVRRPGLRLARTINLGHHRGRARSSWAHCFFRL